MRFKTNKDESLWNADPTCKDKAANAKLKAVVQTVDLFSQVTGNGEITITSYWRPQNARSYHSILQAVDIRVRDKKRAFYWGMETLGKLLRQFDEQIQFDLHKSLYGKPQQHIHVEIDTGTI